MTTLVALLAIMALLVLNTLGNFWFTYGIWPRSWWSLAGFSISSLILTGMLRGVLGEAKK